MQDPQTRMGDMAAHLRAALKYQDNPAYLKWNGHPVVFFWRTDLYGDANAWKALRRAWTPTTTRSGQSIRATPANRRRERQAVPPGRVRTGIHVFASAKYNATTNVANNDQTWRNTVDSYNTRRPGANRIWTAGVIPGWDESRALPPRPTRRSSHATTARSMPRPGAGRPPATRSGSRSQAITSGSRARRSSRVSRTTRSTWT